MEAQGKFQARLDNLKPLGQDYQGACRRLIVSPLDVQHSRLGYKAGFQMRVEAFLLVTLTGAIFAADYPFPGQGGQRLSGPISRTTAGAPPLNQALAPPSRP
jgi:hypothetical protein